MASPSGTIPQAQPISDEKDESALAHISSRQGSSPTRLYRGGGQGEKDTIVYFLRRLNISPGVLDYVLKDTDREDKGQQKVLLPLRFASEFTSALL